MRERLLYTRATLCIPFFALRNIFGSRGFVACGASMRARDTTTNKRGTAITIRPRARGPSINSYISMRLVRVSSLFPTVGARP